jgi:2-C-methyl-D-erythritol 2,4-cyclodiphosphate synthase
LNFKNIDSKILLAEVNKLMKTKGWTISNIDSTVVMERPKLKDHIHAMRKSIASILNIHIEQVSVKATTSEKMGFVGHEEGVKAYAVALLMEDTGD